MWDRKRHVLVDTLGLRWLVHVAAASVQGRAGARLLLERIFPRGPGRPRLIWVEVAYRAAARSAWIRTHLPPRGLRLEGVGPNAKANANAKGFEGQPRRRGGERPFGWLNTCGRLGKDYEHHVSNSEAMIRAAPLALLLRRPTSHPAF